MSNPELKPCPFCGSTDITYYSDMREDSSRAMVGYSRIECQGCLIKVEDTSIEDWNTRAEAPRGGEKKTTCPICECKILPDKRCPDCSPSVYYSAIEELFRSWGIEAIVDQQHWEKGERILKNHFQKSHEYQAK